MISIQAAVIAFSVYSLVLLAHYSASQDAITTKNTFLQIEEKQFQEKHFKTLVGQIMTSAQGSCLEKKQKTALDFVKLSEALATRGITVLVGFEQSGTETLFSPGQVTQGGLVGEHALACAGDELQIAEVTTLGIPAIIFSKSGKRSAFAITRGNLNVH